MGDAETPAPRNPWANSFVPNLVWLPRQVAKLTDREGSFTQIYLQALSTKIYRRLEVPAPLAARVEKIWDSLPEPTGIPEQGLPALDSLNFFELNGGWLERRVNVLGAVVDALEKIDAGTALPERVVSRRYAAGLPGVCASARQRLHRELSEYADSVRSAAESSDEDVPR